MDTNDQKQFVNFLRQAIWLHRSYLWSVHKNDIIFKDKKSLEKSQNTFKKSEKSRKNLEKKVIKNSMKIGEIEKENIVSKILWKSMKKWTILGWKNSRAGKSIPIFDRKIQSAVIVSHK